MFRYMFIIAPRPIMTDIDEIRNMFETVANELDRVTESLGITKPEEIEGRQRGNYSDKQFVLLYASEYDFTNELTEYIQTSSTFSNCRVTSISDFR